MHTERVHESTGESQFHSNCCQGPGDQTWTTSLAGLLHQGYSVSCRCCAAACLLVFFIRDILEYKNVSDDHCSSLGRDHRFEG